MSLPARGNALPALCLLTGAIVWGLIWYPYRVVEAAGVPAVSAAVLTYLAALVVAALTLGRQLRALRPDPMLLAIGLAAGGCNLGYVIATVEGEVMRVLLLFYLAPLWTVVLARLLLGERLRPAGAGVIALSLAGAATMLWQPQLGAPWPAAGAEWIGMLAGFLFALSNVLVRKAHALSIELKSMAVFLGVVLVGLAVAPLRGDALVPAALGGEVLFALALVGVILVGVNLVVQHGLMRTGANQAIVIFLFELVVAGLSAWWLAGEQMSLQEWLGGAMIVAASLLSGRLAQDASARAPHRAQRRAA